MSGKVRYHELSESEKKKYLGDFYSMVSLLKDRDEVKSFFKDLLTLSEVVMISRRIQIAIMLLEGYTYDEIKTELRVGVATICNVEKWLNSGFGGYKKAIEKYKKNHKENERDEFNPEEMVPYSHAWVRKKYPLYYLLDNIVKKKSK